MVKFLQFLNGSGSTLQSKSQYFIEFWPKFAPPSKMATLTPNSFKSQKLPVDGFNWKAKKSRFTKKFIQNYDDDSSKGYILEVDDSYPKRLQEIHSDFLFLPECMKIEKCQKHVCSMYDVKNVYTKKNMKLALDYSLIL